MKKIQPNKKEIVAWNMIAVCAGLAFGDTGYIYAAMVMFLCYSIFALFHDLGERKASRLNHFIIGLFALVNWQIAGPTGLSLTIMLAINMYILFYLIMPMAQIARNKHKKIST